MPSLLQYALGPAIGAAIGWATNWVAIKMLFRPRREVRILGLRLQGLIPKRKAEIVERVAEIVAEELVNREDIREMVESAGLESVIMKKAEEEIDEWVCEKLSLVPGWVPDFPVIAIAEAVRRSATSLVAERLPRVTESILEAVRKNADLKRLIVEKMNKADLDELETMIRRLAHRELRAIELAGAVLGLMVGSVHSLALWVLG